MSNTPIDEPTRQTHLWCSLLLETITQDSNEYDYIVSVEKADEKYRAINPLGFDLSGIPEVAHLGVLRGLAKVVEDCQKYADCERNGRPHLVCVVLPAVKHELALALTEESILDDTTEWLNANGKEKVTHHGWGEKTTEYIPAWNGPSRAFTDVILDHYRPQDDNLLSRQQANAIEAASASKAADAKTRELPPRPPQH